MNNRAVRKITRWESTWELPSGVQPSILEEWHPEFACLICEAYMAHFAVKREDTRDHLYVATLALGFISENGTSMDRKADLLAGPVPPEGWKIGGGKGWKKHGKKVL